MMEKPLANANKPELDRVEREALCINCQHTTALSVGGLCITISYINTVPSAEVFVCVCHLAQRLEVGLHDELVIAELTATCVRALDPLVEAGLMHKAQTTSASARGDERTLLVSLTVTDPTQANKIHAHTETFRTRGVITEAFKSYYHSQ